MKIIINGRFLSQRITGVQRFAIEIIRELDKIVKNDDYEIFVPKCCNVNIDLKNIHIIESDSSLNGILWDIFSFSSYVREQSAISVNLCNGITLHNPNIVCIHDVTYKANPSFHSGTIKDKFRMYWNRFTYFFNVKYSDHIVTVSEFSKKEIIKYYRVNSERIFVIHNAWQHVNRIDDIDIKERYSFLEAGNYFFSMSTLAANKNFKWILNAAKNNSDSIFVIAGGGNLKCVADASIGLSNLPNVYFLGYITDEEAKCLIKNCKAFIFPSLYEGFGLPPLEAMGMGCKNVIVSDIEVMHEIFEDTVNYINPRNFDSKISMKKAKFYKEALHKYSWEKSAKLLFNLINSIKR